MLAAVLVRRPDALRFLRSLPDVERRRLAVRVANCHRCLRRNGCGCRLPSPRYAYRLPRRSRLFVSCGMRPKPRG